TTATGYARPRRRANRKAREPFSQRKIADIAKTAKKRTALPPRIVQNTPVYPIAENQVQSTRKSVVRPSTTKHATMTITATEMALLGIPASLCARLVRGPATGSHLG